MLESMITTNGSGGVTLESFLLCTLASLALGFLAAGIYMFRNTYSKSFVTTLTLLPVMVQVVIMLVNGNLGTGVAVMGAFGLIRFRSVPGSAKEIGSIFMAMAVGLATGTGYLGIAVIFLVVTGLVSLLLTGIGFGQTSKPEKELKITIPENLDYTGIFDDLFEEYTKKAELLQVKTTNMGSLYELKYHIILSSPAKEKEMIDAIRRRNGNLPIVCGRVSFSQEAL